MRSKLARFPEIVDARIDVRHERLEARVEPSFEQYVALQHALEEAGGAIQMFHPEYLVPQAHYAVLGVRERTPEKLEQLEAHLRTVPGVRCVIVDPVRWFRNEQGLDVGGAVVFADTHPRLERELIRRAREVGFLYEPKEHGHGGDAHEEWSELNHAFAGLCLIVLSFLGALQVGLARPPGPVRYGTVFVWFALFVFLFVRSDRDAWPLGPIGWFESFRDPETAQHRLGIGLLLAVALGDYWRIRRGWKANPIFSRWGMLALGLVGSGMLFRHLHNTIDPAHAAIAARMNAQHIAMAICALLFAISKFAWDTWQLPRGCGRYLWLVFLAAMGVCLNLYVE